MPNTNNVPGVADKLSVRPQNGASSSRIERWIEPGIPEKSGNSTYPEDRNSETWRSACTTGPISSSPNMLKLLDEATRIARSEVSALVTGESGTGKELLARLIHDSSRRAHGPFVAVNCGGLPHDLVEAELFGVERGAATGVHARPGKFELADGGTLLLDEIGDMSPHVQAMILRVLEDGFIHRVGSTKARPVSVRIVAATNRDVGELVKAGRFREDLFYRIAAWVCHLPPLERRREDIPHLVNHFLSIEQASTGWRCRGVTDDTMDALVSFHWPGNIRQLKNEIARALALAPQDGRLTVEHLSPTITEGFSDRTGGTLRQQLATVERSIIEDAMCAALGNLTAVARRLDVPISTLYRRIKVLGIDRLSCGRQYPDQLKG